MTRTRARRYNPGHDGLAVDLSRGATMRVTLTGHSSATTWSDRLGTVSFADASNLAVPGFRLLRLDDAWRPFAECGAASANADGGCTLQSVEPYGGARPLGMPEAGTFPEFFPAGFDRFYYGGDLKPWKPSHVELTAQARPVQAAGQEGMEFTFICRDRRTADGSGGVIALPVGVELPVSAQARAYGTTDMYFDPRQLDYCVGDPQMPRAWYYLEAELFGLYRSSPSASDPDHQPGRPADRVHSGAPFAAFTDDGRVWWCIASEVEYGAATVWGNGRMRHFTTLYLKPGGCAQWKLVVWRQESRNPQALLLSATRPDGFFNVLNPLEFIPKGTPTGPILFETYSRLRLQLDQIAALRPGLVLINYQYSHISCLANCYDRWTTYEGFHTNEQELRTLIADLRKLGCKVGCYGSQAIANEELPPVEAADWLMDSFGRRTLDWEAGNYLVDQGNRGCAERMARAEAEFARYYGMDAVFSDRLDFMGVNHNPSRIGDTERLELVPSMRLGMIHGLKEKMRWHRRLNPDLYVGVNNTTKWAGIRYSDFNLLEGGDQEHDLCLPYLMQPSGVVNKRHFECLFGDVHSVFNLAVVEQNMNTDRGGFLRSLDDMIRLSLLTGAIAQPYGDEYFVGRDSPFFKPGISEDRDKALPDEEKWKALRSVPWYGGTEWRAMWERVAPAIEAARRLTIPVRNCVDRPAAGSLPAEVRFFARQGDGGGLYIGVQNKGAAAAVIDVEVFDRHIAGEVAPGKVRAWWLDAGAAQATSVEF